MNDKRNGRFKLGHEMENMGLLLRYLDQAAGPPAYPELSTVPIVGWLGQNGSRMCADLYARAPKRAGAGDSFPTGFGNIGLTQNAVCLRVEASRSPRRRARTELMRNFPRT